MCPARDQIYAEPRSVVDDFNFDADVANVFDDMIRRSVPGYDSVIGMLGVFACRFAQEDSRIYDLGCSLGSGALSMRQALQGRALSIIAVDKSAAMIQRCTERLATENATQNAAESPSIELHCADVLDVSLSQASLVVMNFTLQFLPVRDRTRMLERVYKGLLPGGALVLSEKLSFAREVERNLFEDLHDEFRRRNGYSRLEISQKRSALENVLFTETEDQHHERLVEVGFGSVHTWFRCANFGSLVAIKSRHGDD